MKDGDSEKLIFQDAVRKKMKKLASYRQQGFEKVGLFVFYDEPPIPIHLEELKNCFDEILNEYRPIERNAYNRLQYEARIKVEG